MANVQEHPHFDLEDQHLKRTVSTIEQYIEEKTPAFGHAADQKTAHLVRNVQYDLLQKAKDARQHPYFGRVDWQREQDGTWEAFYIGKTPFQAQEGGPQIFAWQDTLVSDLYYQLATDREKGTLLLKRELQIEENQLERIADVFVDESLEIELTDERSDQLLVELLQQTRGGRLQSIVATIRRKQHQIITAPENQILVVEGPPGSGKTEIALHRVSYILYQDRELHSRQTKRVLVLGPNRLFVNYTSGVLPSLGERSVNQQAFDEWLYRLLDSDFDYEPQHLSLEVLLDMDAGEHVKTMRYRNAVHKSSLKMGRLLENYVALLQAEILEGKQDLVCEATIPGLGNVSRRMTPEQISGRLEENIIASRPFNERRAVLEERLAEFLFRQIDNDYNERGSRLGESARNQIMEAFTRQIHAYFENWRGLNVSVAYRRLLRTPRLLRDAGAGIFSAWDLELLAQDAPTALTPFRFSDLPALMYLKIKLDGLPEQPYDHIVIDEAQDVTPLQFKLLTLFCPKKHMTVMGDMKQGIFTHHGVRTWSQLAGEESFTFEYIPNSYRSTMQINSFANQLLRRVGVASDQLIHSVSREGTEPELQGFDTLEALAEAAIDVVQEAVKQGWKTVAIIGKNSASCRRIVQALTRAGLDDVQLITDVETDDLAQVVVIPLHLAKGLEFDVVVLADADANTYPADRLHTRLLYVGVTRAAHQLFVYWEGQISPLLDNSVSTVELAQPYGRALEPSPATIREFATENHPLDAAWCVERMAGAEKLHLLENGRIDQTVLAVLLTPYMRNLQRTAEHSIQPLDAQTRAEIVALVRSVRMDPEAQTGLALTQLTYGLLRNQMRFAGLQLEDVDAERKLEEQIILLRTFHHFLEQDRAMLLSGRWTTRRVVLNLLADGRKEQAADLLNLLIDYGVVEKNKEQIRVSSDLAYELLNTALGEESTGWDPDLNALLPLPPRMFAAAGRLEVSHAQ